MKRFLLAVVIVAMGFGLTGCGPKYDAKKVVMQMNKFAEVTDEAIEDDVISDTEADKLSGLITSINAIEQKYGPGSKDSEEYKQAIGTMSYLDARSGYLSAMFKLAITTGVEKIKVEE